MDRDTLDLWMTRDLRTNLRNYIMRDLAIFPVMPNLDGPVWVAYSLDEFIWVFDSKRLAHLFPLLPGDCYRIRVRLKAPQVTML